MQNEIDLLRHRIAGLEKDKARLEKEVSTLRKSDEHFQAVIQNIPALIAILDEAGIITYANPLVEFTLGYSQDELVGKSVFDFIAPDDRSRALDNFRAARINSPSMYAVVHRDGSERILEIFGCSLPEHPVLAGYVAIFRDVTDYEGAREELDRYRGSTKDSPGEPRAELSKDKLQLLIEIMERKRVEAALRESEEKFRNLAEKSIVGIYLIQNDVFKYVNSMLAEIFEYPLEEIIDNIRVEDMVFAADRVLVKTNMASRMEGDAQPRHYEFRVCTKSGNIRYVEVYSSFTTYQRQPAIIGTILDITKRKKMEEALRESEEKYRILLEESSDPIFSLTPEGRYTYVNRAFAEGVGGRAGNIIGRSVWDIFPREEAEERFANLDSVCRTGRKKAFELSTWQPDGERYYITTMTPIKNMAGVVVSAICSSKDITERRQAEEALRKSEGKYRTLVNNINQGIIVAQDGMLKFVNPMSVRIMGHAEQDLLAKPFIEFIHPDDRALVLDRHLRRLRGEKLPSKYEFRFVDAAGDTKWTTIDSIIISWGGKPANLAFFTDITERKLLESQYLRAQKMEAVGTLAGGIAHDFNNLLAGIQGYTSLALLEIVPSHPIYDKLQRIQEQVQSGANLTSQLLGFARGGKSETKPADMNEILEKTSSLFGRTKKEIVIGQSLAENLWTVEVDRGQMEQVLLNLYVNAWHAMPGGGNIHLATENIFCEENRAQVYDVKPGRYVKITVQDTGTGMDEKTRERIFEPFFTTKTTGRGTGLGLATVYSIVKGHRGALNVYSKPGRGTIFNIYLPASEKQVFAEATPEGAIARGTETILLVDDENTVLEVNKKMLESLGCLVYPAASGQEALALYREKRDAIDLVVLDMILPGMSGGETFDRLRDIDPAVRIILCSGYSMDGDSRTIMEKGCNGFIQKPFTLSDLSRKLREVLDAET